MSFFESHWVLTVLLLLPLAGAVACLFAGKDEAKHVALVTSIAAFLLSLPLFWVFREGTPAIQNYVSIPWIGQWGIAYTVGVDGISLLMVLLTTFIMPMAILGSYSYIKRQEPTYYAMLLLLMTAMIGVFIALDMFLFFLFWELMLIPMYFIIGVWGGERRIYAAIKFFLFTAVGSLLMLVAIVTLVYLYYRQYGVVTFAYNDLVELPVTRSAQFWLFSAFALAFAIKVPLFPVHTWLPDAHVEAPTAGSVILAGVLLKMGTYGFLRFAMPFFAYAATSDVVVYTILTLSLIGIVYGAWVAAVQPDAKKLVAYTSVAHLGFVMLGLFALTSESIQGGILQMVNHGISTGALFLLIGMLYERRHTRLIEDFGGIAKVMPFFAFAFVVVALSSIGLPGTNGFVGEFLILIGTFRTHPVAAVIAATGVVFAAAYMLPMVQRVLYGPVEDEENRELTDIGLRERIVLLPALAMIVLIGVYPGPFLEKTSASVDALLQQIEMRASQAPLEPLGTDVRFDHMPILGVDED
ncbi:MAG: NADH-quinone oxidoreductase subunit M [marine benthic group bacterium]|nr:NADH-quinone oxidoreductase subunit M [Gemmatimonadota bacterium]MCL7961704.1 NADH-quinone oxidoreductase subunit M [Candidatus Carthagonibacter metallireducens]MCL7957117.1 NADH-quinone oxidoreductase subunit M [Gemmatimonadota bacterium]MCL7964371.1 NADH-quinone oxidoreductase subunit M [Gemmatimonadota bacterium]MCL7967938.1 NADH-quinone oxidoreductase subunit M [Gemmatimonadota bacterium]